jgi:hypothetical protein
VSPIDGVNGVRRNLLARIGLSAGYRMSGARGRSGSAALSLSTHKSPFAIRRAFRLATAVHTSFVSTAMSPCVASIAQSMQCLFGFAFSAQDHEIIRVGHDTRAEALLQPELPPSQHEPAHVEIRWVSPAECLAACPGLRSCASSVLDRRFLQQGNPATS